MGLVRAIDMGTHGPWAYSKWSIWVPVTHGSPKSGELHNNGVDVRWVSNPSIPCSKLYDWRFQLFQKESPPTITDLRRFINLDLPPCSGNIFLHFKEGQSCWKYSWKLAFSVTLGLMKNKVFDVLLTRTIETKAEYKLTNTAVRCWTKGARYMPLSRKWGM